MALDANTYSGGADWAWWFCKINDDGTTTRISYDGNSSHWPDFLTMLVGRSGQGYTNDGYFIMNGN